MVEIAKKRAYIIQKTLWTLITIEQVCPVNEREQTEA